MAQNNSIEQLYKRYLANDLNEEELADFLQRLNNPGDEETVSHLMEGTWKEMYEVPNRSQLEAETPIIPLYRRKFFKWSVAACIILLLGIATYTVISNLSTGGEKSSAPMATTRDIPAPSNTRAVITLADGSKIYLDSLGNGVIAQENNVNVVKNEKGEIVYQGASLITHHTVLTYNTLFNPRGSKVISLTLSDGTKVWLNSESSLKYPTAFTSNTREVEITGEAYFEVKHNSEHPFRVHLPNGSVVEDIGTEFNVNAYADETDIKATLIGGSVRVFPNFVSPASSAVILKPGQQVVIKGHSTLTTHSADIDEIIAWKNGMFLFDNTDLPTIMRQIARWYDLNVFYEGSIPDKKFGGGVSRNLPLSKILELLQANGMKFKVEGRTITVLK